MFKRFSVLFFGVLAVACSDDPTAAELEACQSELASGIQFADGYAYTGDTYTLSGTKFCASELEAIVLNDVEVSFKEKLETKVSITVPESITADSATIKIKTKTGVVDLHKKIAIFPGSGTWTEVEPFPGPVRTGAQAAVLNGKGYVSGGEHFIDYTNGMYNTTRHNDLYAFDPAANSWTLITQDDNFKDKAASFGWNNELFLFPNLVFGPVTTFGLDDKVFEKTQSFSASWALNVLGFQVGEDLYIAVTENSTKKIDIRKYNAATKAWDIQQSTAFNAENTLLDFAFEHDGMVYLGWNALNSSVIELWTYDAGENQLTKINTVEVSDARSLLRIRHLFTLKDLAYFVETGDASIGPDGASVVNPSPKLYLYNLKTQAWRQVAHTFPENMFGVVSFTIAGRGFAGMSAASGKPTFKYSNKFYEFKAK